ncbi:MAG: NINE protein [Spirulina sp.]
MVLSPSQPRRRSIAVALAWLGVVLAPGLHKFYLGQPGWGIAYLLLSWTPIPRVACALEGAWLLGRPPEFFGAEPKDLPSPPSAPIDPSQVNALGVALRELDSLRQEGLISEAEFEQKRRQLLERVG